MTNFKLLKSHLQYDPIERTWKLRNLVQGHPLWRYCCLYCEQHRIWNIYHDRHYNPLSKGKVLKRLTHIIQTSKSQNPLITQYKSHG